MQAPTGKVHAFILPDTQVCVSISLLGLIHIVVRVKLIFSRLGQRDQVHLPMP
jgi:hypothetical protein